MGCGCVLRVRKSDFLAAFPSPIDRSPSSVRSRSPREPSPRRAMNVFLFRSSGETQVISLDGYGWCSFFAQAFVEYESRGLVPARVLSESKTTFRVVAECGEVTAELAGRARHDALDQEALPTVGDWVALRLRSESETSTIQAVLPRRSQFIRKVAGTRTAPQVVAANVDLVFLVMGLDGDFNLRRLERYLTISHEGGVAPVVVLNKADLCDDVVDRYLAVDKIALGLPIHVVSAHTTSGLDSLSALLRPCETIALLGSSGVGKSSLANRFAGSPLQLTNEVRESDSRGRHTTTRRDLILLPSGALLIDTPGMRELQPWSVGDGLDAAFDDISTLASTCRFRDCRHEGEPGCAIASAIDDGTLDTGRLRNSVSMRKEAESAVRRQDVRARLAEKARWKSITKSMRKHKKGW
jgi:ribosome biogenesis GTPase / thiamine phosphate phosphatase